MLCLVYFIPPHISPTLSRVPVSVVDARSICLFYDFRNCLVCPLREEIAGSADLGLCELEVIL